MHASRRVRARRRRPPPGPGGPQRRRELRTRPSCDCRRTASPRSGPRALTPNRLSRPGSRTSRTYLRRPSPADAKRTISPTCSSTSRWWASRFEGMREPFAELLRRPVADVASSSTIARRAGSPSAAWTAERRATESAMCAISTDRHDSHSADLESIVAEWIHPVFSGCLPGHHPRRPAAPARTRNHAHLPRVLAFEHAGSDQQGEVMAHRGLRAIDKRRAGRRRTPRRTRPCR